MQKTGHRKIRVFNMDVSSNSRVSQPANKSSSNYSINALLGLSDGKSDQKNNNNNKKQFEILDDVKAKCSTGKDIIFISMCVQVKYINF